MKENKRLAAELLKWARLLVIACLAAGIGIWISAKFNSAKEPELTSSFVNGKLEAASDLTTSELLYTGLIRYSQGSIPLLTQKSFSMMYTALVRAGIDLSKAQIQITDDKVEITLPECEIQSVDIDTGSIEFYDEHWALFNRTEKTDVIDTVSAAKEDVRQKADMEKLLENARIRTNEVIEGLLEDAVGDRELVIK